MDRIYGRQRGKLDGSWMVWCNSGEISLSVLSLVKNQEAVVPLWSDPLSNLTSPFQSNVVSGSLVQNKHLEVSPIISYYFSIVGGKDPKKN